MMPPSMGKGWGKGSLPPSGWVPPTIPQYQAEEAGEASLSEPREEPPRVSKTESAQKQTRVRRFLAYMFTISNFVLMSAPTIISIKLGMDVDASFWIGRYGLLAVAVPIFIIVQHLYHLMMIDHTPSRRRYIFLVVPVVPAVLFMVIGGIYMSESRYLYGQLRSDDCAVNSAMPEKFAMENAYVQAREAYDQCRARLLKQNMGQPLRRHPNLQSCSEWDELLEGSTKGVQPWKGQGISSYSDQLTLRRHNPGHEHRWQYLADVELNHMCGGFCEAGPTLFVSYASTGRQGTSCSQVVAFKFLAIWHWATVVFAIGLVTLVLCIPTYVWSRSYLAALGYKSAVTLA